MISITEQIEAMEREIKYRLRVYPRLVMDEKMSQDLAKRHEPQTLPSFKACIRRS